MTTHRMLLERFYRGVLTYPKWVISAILLLCFSLAFHIKDFRLDASADSLVLENDQAVQLYQQLSRIYGNDDYLILTVSPVKPLFSEQVLQQLTVLQTKIESLDNVASVQSILNVPLFKSRIGASGITTLSATNSDHSLAQQELVNSKFYQNLLVNKQQSTTALIINLAPDKAFAQIAQHRQNIKTHVGQSARRSTIEQHYRQLQQKNYQQNALLIKTLREIIAQHHEIGRIHLGGLPMIIADSIDFIKHDLATFGLAVVIFIIFLLLLFFTRISWVVLALSTCLIVTLIMLGTLALMQWPVTVVSANFISLMLILTLSITIHLIVAFNEFARSNTGMPVFRITLLTISHKFTPCLFTTLTSMIAFGSLAVSDIRPIIDFGWMMTVGMAVSFIITLLFFPAAIMMIHKEQFIFKQSSVINSTKKFTHLLARLCLKHPTSILVIAVVLAAFGSGGVSRLSVDNRFVDYFKSDTEIYQGMVLIDAELGGTTPLDIIIDAPAGFIDKEPEDRLIQENSDLSDEELELLSELDLANQENQADALPIIARGYWFNPQGLELINQIHQLIEQHSQTGKVLSLYSGIDMLSPLVGNLKTDMFNLSVAYKKLPEAVKAALIRPYIREDGNQIRISVRVFETDEALNRQQLIHDLNHRLTQNTELTSEQITFSGMYVLYKNMLQSLFSSQLSTITLVFFTIFIMFALLFRSLKLALVTITPNIVAALLILGLMGWLAIPLDIMTVTIAAICTGIAVDDSIHYIYRLRQEYLRSHNMREAIAASHVSIGRAMYYTSITVTLGFSILVLSNFMPSIYFGVFTGLSMILALVANLTLLPVLVVKFSAIK